MDGSYSLAGWCCLDIFAGLGFFTHYGVLVLVEAHYI
jgi:hypothetical protein